MTGSHFMPWRSFHTFNATRGLLLNSWTAMQKDNFKQDLSALSFIFLMISFFNSVFKLDAVQRCCCLVLFYFCFTFLLLKTYMMLYCALASHFPSHQLHVLLHYFYKLDKCILCFKIESALSNCVFSVCSLSVMRKEHYIYLFAFTLTLCIVFFNVLTCWCHIWEHTTIPQQRTPPLQLLSNTHTHAHKASMWQS